MAYLSIFFAVATGWRYLRTLSSAPTRSTAALMSMGYSFCSRRAATSSSLMPGLISRQVCSTQTAVSLPRLSKRSTSHRVSVGRKAAMAASTSSAPASGMSHPIFPLTAWETVFSRSSSHQLYCTYSKPSPAVSSSFSRDMSICWQRMARVLPVKSTDGNPGSLP